jgi:hypothetical protein
MNHWQAVCCPSREESGRFLKKAAQKLLLRWAMGCVSDNTPGPES